MRQRVLEVIWAVLWIGMFFLFLACTPASGGDRWVEVTLQSGKTIQGRYVSRIALGEVRRITVEVRKGQNQKIDEAQISEIKDIKPLWKVPKVVKPKAIVKPVATTKPKAAPKVAVRTKAPIDDQFRVPTNSEGLPRMLERRASVNADFGPQLVQRMKKVLNEEARNPKYGDSNRFYPLYSAAIKSGCKEFRDFLKDVIMGRQKIFDSADERVVDRVQPSEKRSYIQVLITTLRHSTDAEGLQELQSLHEIGLQIRTRAESTPYDEAQINAMLDDLMPPEYRAGGLEIVNLIYGGSFSVPHWEAEKKRRAEEKERERVEKLLRK